MAKVTIYDVSGVARVSLATVSRVVNTPELVKPETRDRVLAVIKELGYKPNAIAKGLASRKTTTVGVMISDITRASVSEMLGGIMDIAKEYSYSIKIFSMQEDNDVSEVVRTVVAEQVDGVLLLNDELSENDIESIAKVLDDSNVPFVLGNLVSSNKKYPSVNIAYEKIAYELTKDLILDGRKDIYLLSTYKQYTTNKQKENGYLKAMNEAKLEPKILRTSGNIVVNKQHFETYFSENKVDAVISVRDSIGVSFINVARLAGREIPKQICVVGFQNTKYAQLSRPSLTCVGNPVYAIGAVSMRLLTKYMADDLVENDHIILPGSLVYRESFVKKS